MGNAFPDVGLSKILLVVGFSLRVYFFVRGVLSVQHTGRHNMIIFARMFVMFVSTVTHSLEFVTGVDMLGIVVFAVSNARM